MFFWTMILEKTFVREIAVPRSVVLWNYLDLEHLRVVHRGYVASELIYEDERVALEHLTLRVPYLPFVRSRSVHFFVKNLPGEIIAWNIGLFGIPCATRIILEELEAEHCRITTTYRFWLAGWRRLLAYVLPTMIRRWNDRIWDEDFPMRERRHRVLKAGFTDAKTENVDRDKLPVRASLLWPYPHGPLSRMLADWT